MSALANALEAARSSVLVLPAPELGALVAHGKDRQSWLNGLLTCDLAPKKPGEGAYGLAVTQKGRILTDVVVVLEEGRALVLAERPLLAELAASFDHYLIMEDVELTVDPQGLAVRFAHGPSSPAVLEAARAAGASGVLLDRTGRGGAVVVATPVDAAKVDEAIAAEVKAQGGVVGEASAWDALSLEEAVPRFGSDFGGQTYPQEAGLERTAVSFNKGCYLGQEVICMLEMRGHVKRRLVQLAVDGAGVPEAGAALVDGDGAHLGTVTRAGTSPSREGAVLALAMVKRAFTEPGTELRLGDRTARVLRVA